MIICLSCNSIFDDEECFQTDIGVEGESYTSCPHCGSMLLEEANYCFNCNEYKTKAEMSNMWVCRNCVYEKLHDFDSLIDFIVDQTLGIDFVEYFHTYYRSIDMIENLQAVFLAALSEYVKDDGDYAEYLAEKLTRHIIKEII